MTATRQWNGPCKLPIHREPRSNYARPPLGRAYVGDEDDVVRAWVEAIDELSRRRYGSGVGERIAEGHEGGGRFRKLSDQITDLLAKWAKGEGKDDPLDELSTEQLRKTAVEAAKKARAAGDNERAARLTPRRRRPGEPPEDAIRDELKLALYKDVRGSVRGERESKKPEASGRVRFTLAGAKNRDLDVGVYSENGKVSLWEVSDSGERRRRVALVDDLAGLEQWAKDNGESEVADWARKERGESKAPDVPATGPDIEATREQIRKLRDQAQTQRTLASMRIGNNPPGSYQANKGEENLAESERLNAEADRLEASIGGPGPKPEPLTSVHTPKYRATAVPVRVVLAENASSDSSTWKATGFEGLDRDVPGAAAAVTTYLRRPGFVNTRLRTPEPDKSPGGWQTWTHDPTPDELTGRVPFDEAAEAKAAARADRQVAALDRVMDQSRTERPMKVYRGASPDDLDLPADPVGHEWTDPGYASTATSRRIAENSFAGKGRVLLTVQVPEGTPALQIDGLGETEVLLGRGQRYRVVADHGLTPGGARHVEVEIVPSAAPDVPAKATPTGTFDSRLKSAASGQQALAAAPTLVHYDEDADKWTVTGVPNADKAGQAVHDYWDYGQDVNKYLRNGPEGFKGDRFSAAKVQRTIDGMDGLFEQSRLDKPVVTWRGFGGRSTFGADPDSWPDDLTGKEWTDKAYVSTTVDRAEAANFTVGGSAGPTDQRGVLARMVLPEGAPVLSLAEMEAGEMLTSRGWRFRVVRDHGWQDEKRGSSVRQHRVLDVEAIPPQSTEAPSGPAKATKAAKKAAPKVIADATPERQALAKGAVKRYVSGETIESVAASMGLSPTTVRRLLIESGIEMRKLGGSKPRPVDISPAPSVDLDHLRTLDPEAARDELDLLKVDQLKPLLKAQGLPVSGKKRDLVDRLVGSLGQPTREERIQQLMLAGLTRDEAEAQLGKTVRRSADPEGDDDTEDLTDDDAPGPDEVGDEDEEFDDDELATIHALLDEDDDYPEAQRADLALGRERLHHYWTRGKGLAKWLGKPHPWTSLYRHLRKYVGSERAKRMAAKWVHEVTGNWPGSDRHRVATGHKPRGHRIGPG